MKSNSHEQDKRHAFDNFCKKVLKHEARDYYDELKRQRNKEISFSNLSVKEMDQLYTEDKYFVTEQIFNVLGLDVIVSDDVIAGALENLPECKRDIILLSYFLELSDREIGDRLNMLRSTVQYQRTSTLQQLKNLWRKISMSNKKRNSHLLSYHLIVLASAGDVDAINAVLKHYEGYMAVLSMRTFYDEGGNPHLCIDEALRRRLETKLITKILTFNAA